MPTTTRLLPFLWLHGESEETLRQGVRAIAASGCGAVCAESRVHPDFLGDSWWQEIDILLDECKRLGLDLWLLDDAHFPSGYANGAAAGTPYCRMMMNEIHMDVSGPRKGGRILVRPDGATSLPVAVVAGRRVDRSHIIEAHIDIGSWSVTDLVDLTDRVEDGFVRWDVPEGDWRVFILTANYVAERNPPQFFANPLLPEGGRLMIDTVYEAHYQHMKADFGKTFKGFFSDEPALRAGRGSRAIPGEYPHLPYPWRMDMPELLTKQLGKPARVLLPGLWYDIGEDTRRIRYAMMDTVSRLYGENYSTQIGDWCRAHGVAYVGHVIEQNNAHSRLGQGAGHFFRAMSGQDMAGMDFVLHEMKPEFRNASHAWNTQDFEADDDFFRYMLPQMTVSCAHLDPKKKGRSLCEIFGAYGWQEDAAEMRYLANMLMARGINHFTPHAFTLKPYPDPDSPPHFGDFNPLMPALTRLHGHMARVASLLDGGAMVARAGVLYYAEAEWAQGNACMKTQTLVKALNMAHIPCEIVPIDQLQPGRYDVLYIPRGKYFPLKLFPHLRSLMDAGCRVVFADALPEGLSEGEGDMAELTRGMQVLPLAQIAAHARTHCQLPAHALTDSPDIHTYLYRSGEGKLLTVLFNEDTRDSHAITMDVPELTTPVLYDSEMQQCCVLESSPFTATVEPGQLLILADHQPDWGEPRMLTHDTPCGTVSPLWHITFPGTDYAPIDTDTPGDLNEVYPRFSGVARYEGDLTVNADCDSLLLEDASGSVSLWVDDQPMGHRDAPPYRFPADLPKGTHRLTLEVVNTLVFRHRDRLSTFNYIKPSGLTGAVTCLRCKP